MSTADLLEPLVYCRMAPASLRSGLDEEPAAAGVVVELDEVAKPSLRGAILGDGVCGGSRLQLCRGGMQPTLLPKSVANHQAVSPATAWRNQEIPGTLHVTQSSAVPCSGASSMCRPRGEPEGAVQGGYLMTWHVQQLHGDLVWLGRPHP